MFNSHLNQMHTIVFFYKSISISIFSLKKKNLYLSITFVARWIGVRVIWRITQISLDTYPPINQSINQSIYIYIYKEQSFSSIYNLPNSLISCYIYSLHSTTLSSWCLLAYPNHSSSTQTYGFSALPILQINLLSYGILHTFSHTLNLE